MHHHFIQHLFNKGWSIELEIHVDFFGTTTIGDSQLTSSTRAMKLALKSLSKSRLTIVA